MHWDIKARRPRVLIVEDDPMVLQLIITRLDLAGFEPYFARNGGEGLDRIHQLRPDGMVLDINMPVMSGFAVLAHLQSIRSFYPPTLVLTARNRPEDIKTAISLGARDFLAKPFKDEQLIARVGRLVRTPTSPPGTDIQTPRHGPKETIATSPDDGPATTGDSRQDPLVVEI